LNAVVFADNQQIAYPGQMQAGALEVAAAADAAGRGTDIGGRFQLRLDRADDFALRLGALFRKARDSAEASTSYLERASSSERVRSNIEGATRIIASNASRARTPRSCLSFAVLRLRLTLTSLFPYPRTKVQGGFKKPFPN
jgi:hypothetical protein